MPEPEAGPGLRYAPRVALFITSLWRWVCWLSCLAPSLDNVGASSLPPEAPGVQQR